MTSTKQGRDGPPAPRRASRRRRVVGRVAASWRPLAAVLAIAVLLGGCSESGDEDDERPDEVSRHPWGDGTLRGTIVYEGADTVLQAVDLDSGVVGPHGDDTPVQRRPSATAETARTNGSVLEIRDALGEITASVTVDGSPPERVALSPTAQLLAYTQDVTSEDGLERSIHVAFARRDGTSLGRHGPDCRDVEWLLDDRAMLACDDRILLLDPVNGSAPETVRTFYAGAEPFYLVLDASGTQLAFELGERAGLYNDVHRMAIDGSDFRQLVRSVVNTDAPSWSPDGRWIAFRRNIPYGAIANGVRTAGGCPTLWIVRADVASTVDLRRAVSGADTRAFEVTIGSGEEGDDTAYALCAWGPPTWLP